MEAIKIGTLEFEKMRRYAELTNSLDKYVVLKKDDKGYFIEYAFKEGTPHDNRCLSWYYSYQEKAYIRNKWFEGLNEEETKERLQKIKHDIDSKVGKLYRTSPFTCGFEGLSEEKLKEKLKEYEESHNRWYPDDPFIPENRICKVGCPAKYCLDVYAEHWTYEEPKKCACWDLIPIVEVPTEITVNFDDYLELINRQ